MPNHRKWFIKCELSLRLACESNPVAPDPNLKLKGNFEFIFLVSNADMLKKKKLQVYCYEFGESQTNAVETFQVY